MEVISLEDAPAATGWEPRSLNDLGRPSNVQVSVGGSGRLIIDVDNARTLMKAAGADLRPGSTRPRSMLYYAHLGA